MKDIRTIQFSVNGDERTAEVETRRTLADVLRDQLGLTGTHLGCEHGVCGVCTVLVDGAAVRSCLMLAVQADGTEVMTVEGLADSDGLSLLQQSFADQHALQCGFCTPGVLMSLTEFMRDNPNPTRADVETALSGNLCRCTGYASMVTAVLDTASKAQETR